MDQPIIVNLVKDYNLEFNILKAYVTPKEEGLLIMELWGRDKDYETGVKYLSDTGVKVEPLSQTVSRNSQRCTYCGVCVPLCPVGAFEVEPGTRKVLFNEDKCIACGLCVNACPPRAMEVRF